MKNKFLLCTFLFLAACSEHKTTELQERQAPADVKASLQTTKVSDKTALKLQKDSLGKTFLLMASTKSGGVAPQWTDLKPQLVFFERHGGKLGLYGLNPTIYSDIKPGSLLSTFEILDESDKDLTFSLEMGIRSFGQGTSYSNPIDNSEQKDSESGADKGLQVKDLITTSAEIKDNAMIITQDMRVTLPSLELKKTRIMGKNDSTPQIKVREVSATLHFTIRPYVENKKFKAQAEDSTLTVGFFTNSVLDKDTEKAKQTIMKWDLDPSRGPVTYIISDSAPEEFRQTLKEAILYWNKVLGREAIVVKIGGDAGQVPEERTVIVRWVPWKTAGFAYAMMQSDPLTSEVLRGQIFMTSSFAGKSAETSSDDGSSSLGIQGLNSARVDCDIAHDLDKSTQALQTVTDKNIQKQMIHDQIRSVLAHEVGHTLGLRHNFAGSFSIKSTTKDVSAAYDGYTKDLSNGGFVTATTVMDYIHGRDEFLLGRYIKDQVLPYDVMAIRWAYLNENKLDQATSLYCSDEHSDLPEMEEGLKVYGCARFDSGNPINSLVQDDIDATKQLVVAHLKKQLKDLFAKETSGIINDTTAINNMGTSILSLSSNSIENIFGLYQVSNGKISVINIDSAKESIKRGAEYGVRYYDTTYLGNVKTDMNKNLQEAGNLGSIASRVSLIDITTGLADKKAISDLVDSVYTDNLRKGTLESGRSYELSPEAWEALKTATKSTLEYSAYYSINWMTDKLQPQGEKSVYTMDGVTKAPVDISGNFTSESVESLLSFASKVMTASAPMNLAGSNVQISLPVHLKETRTKMVPLFNLKNWGLYSSRAASMKTEVLMNSTKIVQTIAAMEDPKGATITDLEKLKGIIGGGNKVPWDLKQMAQTEFTLIEALTKF